MQDGRTKNSIRNIFGGLLSWLVLYLGPFVTRTIIQYTLGAEYVGLNSLFSSILNVLSLAELGFGSAVVYSMYRPVQEKDEATLCALLALYRKLYRYIGLVILTVGVCCAPFLPLLVTKDVPADINLYALYAIYLANTAVTYFCLSYRSSILIAHQRSDIVNTVTAACNLGLYAAQIVLLVTLKNYYAYILVLPLFNILINVINAAIARKKYPQYVCRGRIGEALKADIKKRVSGLMVSKVCAVTRNSLDSIVITAALGLTINGYYNNYFYIMNAINAVLTTIATAVLASVGNSLVCESVEKNYADMRRFNFLYMALSGWCTVCLLCLYQPFMRLWMGEESLLPMLDVVLFCIYFYALRIGDIANVYYQAAGLWWYGRNRAIAESVCNLLLNISLVWWFGIPGVIAATILSIFFINFLWGGRIVFNRYFKGVGIGRYYLDHLLYLVVTAFVCGIGYFACSFLPLGENFIGMVLYLAARLGICVLAAGLYLLVYCRTQRFRSAYDWIKHAVFARRKS